MSSAAAGPSGFVPKSRRPTVKERLARLQGMDETEEEVILFRKEVEAVAQKDIHVVGFRWHGTLQSLPGSQDLLHPVALRISHFLPLCPNHISPFPPFGPRCMSVWSSPTWTALLLFSSVFPHPPPPFRTHFRVLLCMVLHTTYATASYGDHTFVCSHTCTISFPFTPQDFPVVACSHVFTCHLPSCMDVSPALRCSYVHVCFPIHVSRYRQSIIVGNLIPNH